MFESLFDKVAGFQDPAQKFSGKYCESFKNTCFGEHLWTISSVAMMVIPMLISMKKIRKRRSAK